jgi:hypothetical protein
MKNHTNKREQIDHEEFFVNDLQKLMTNLFPKKNDCAPISDLEEVLQELKEFDIRNKKQIRIFLKKYRKWLIEVDQEPMDSMHQRLYSKEIGDEEFNDSMRRQYWFCYPAFIRNAMEVEFGDKYEKYSNERDEI